MTTGGSTHKGMRVLFSDPGEGALKDATKEYGIEDDIWVKMCWFRESTKTHSHS